jgi:type II secretory pathway component PulM
VADHCGDPAAGGDVVNVKKRKLSPVAMSAVVGGGLLLVLVLGMFLLVLPQKNSAAKLAKDIAATETQIVQARALAEQKPAQPIRVADLFKLVKAMPDTPDMTGIMLQLNQTASDSGIEFETIAPGPAELQSGYQKIPIAVGFNGNYYALTDFLFRLRGLVSVRGGALGATGRLFSVQTIAFSAGPGGFPAIAATLTVNAYVYGTVVAGTPPPAPATTTAPTDTTATPPTEEPAPVASGVTN